MADLDIEHIRQEVLKEIELLPQRAILKESNISRWVESVLALDPHRATWHVKRAAGIGGSEIGDLMRDRYGLTPKFNTATEIILSKLLILPPEPPNIHMLKGIKLEDLAQLVHLKLMGGVSELSNHEALFNKPHPQHLFLVGNPDDVQSINGQRVIPDFKVRNDLDWSEEPELNYICQTHLYGEILRANNAPVDFYHIAELDIPEKLAFHAMRQASRLEGADRHTFFDDLAEKIASINIPGFGMRITEIKPNPELVQAMIECANNIWHGFVMKGLIPEQAGSLMNEVTDVVRAQLEQLSDELVKFRLASRAAEERISLTTSRINALLSNYDCSNLNFDIPGLSRSSRTNFNIRAAANQLMTKGVSAEAIINPEKKAFNSERAEKLLAAKGLLSDALYDFEYDARKVKKQLKENQLDEGAFTSVSTSISLSRKKDDQATIEVMQEQLKDHIKQWEPQIGSEDESPDYTLRIA